MKNNIWLLISTVVIAIIIWFLINVTKVHEVSISIPISITNAPTALIPLSIKPQSIELTIEGKGKDIIFYNSNKLSYYIDLKDAHYGKNYYPIDFEKLNIFEKYHLKILHNPSFDNFLITMDNMSSKIVPIKPVFIDEESKKFFLENNLTVSPDQVHVKGPKTLIANIYGVNTLPFNMKNFEDSLQIELTPSLDSKIGYEQLSVLIKKRAPQIIQKTYSLLPILTYKEIEIFPNSVSIQVTGERNVLQNINHEDFIAEIDTTKPIQIDSLIVVKVILPKGVELIAQTPKHVRVKNAQE